MNNFVQVSIDCGPALIIGFAILCAIIILIDTILKLFFKRK